MGTDRKHVAAARSGSVGTARATAKREPAGPARDAAAKDPATTIVRRFRRGRWTLTAVPV